MNFGALNYIINIELAFSLNALIISLECLVNYLLLVFCVSVPYKMELRLVKWRIIEVLTVPSV